MLININITQKHPTVDGTPIIVCNNSGYQIKFTFDDEWAGLEFKTARFVYRKAGKARYIDVPFSGDTVDVPTFTEVGFIWVGVYTDLLQTTTPAKIPCEYSIRCKSGESLEEATQELYDQMMALFNQVVQNQDIAQAAAETATEAKEEAQAAANLAQGAIKGVVCKVIENNADRYVTFWVGTKEQYEAIETPEYNCLYIITDDTGLDEMREDIATVQQAVHDMQAVDISDKLSATLTSDGDPDNIMINDIQATYSPALGIVFYQYSFLSSADLAAGTTVKFSLSGGYGRSKTTAGALICYAKKGALGGYIAGSGDSTSIYIDVYDNISGITLAGFSGWYFCDGE